MRVLIVGAGSVGQVYGWHLQQGGAEVHVFVREKYAAEARAGFVLYPPGKRGKAAAEATRFLPDGIVTDAAGVLANTWDQVWLCVASPALRGPWLADITAAMGSATLVSLTPGLRDRELLLALVPAERLVLGLIAFSSWHAPLTSEVLPEHGMAWWHPPFSPSLFEAVTAGAPDAAIADLLAALKRGGCPAARGDASGMATRGSSFLLPLVAAMECAGWTFAGLRSAAWAELAAGAAEEALTISTAKAGIAKGPLGWLTSDTAIRLTTRVAPLLAPMDFEAFLRVHFSKVGEQTSMQLADWIDEGRARGLPVASLDRLSDELRRARGQGGGAAP